MPLKEEIESIVESMLQNILEEKQFELVDVEYLREAGTWFLRVFIDKVGGITIDDCVHVSQALDLKLDEKDPIVEPYILEVSSPGLDRPLKKEKDFVKSIGKAVELKLYKAINGQKEFSGILDAYDTNEVFITINNEKRSFTRKDIAIIRLAVIF